MAYLEASFLLAMLDLFEPPVDSAFSLYGGGATSCAAVYTPCTRTRLGRLGHVSALIFGRGLLCLLAVNDHPAVGA